jgi:class 3 adenylate cyclase/streptogramin lyase
MDRRGRGSRLAAVLFTDIVRSTETASELGDRRWREVLSRHHRIIRAELKRHGGHEQDTAGDGFFASFDAPADAIRCAIASVTAVRELGVEIRAGVNFGQIEMADGKPGGIVVHAGARIMSQAGAGQVIVSASAHDVVPGAGIGFDDLGERQLKGLDAPTHLFLVTSVDGVTVGDPSSDEVARSRLEGVDAEPVTGGQRWVGVAAGITALVVAGWIVLGGRADVPQARLPPSASGSTTASVPLGAVGEIDPGTGHVEQFVPLPIGSQFIDVSHTMAAGLGAVWIVRNEKIVHLDPLHGDLQTPVPLPGVVISASYSVAIEGGFVWALSEHSLFRVNPGNNAVQQVLSLGRTETNVPFPAQLAAVAGRLWIGTSDGLLIRVDATTGDDRRVRTGPIDAIAADAGAVWTLDRIDGLVTRFDPQTLQPDTPIELTTNASELIVDEAGKLWALDPLGGALTQIDTRRSIDVGADPTAVVAGLGALWVGGADGILRRVDSTTGVTTEFPVGSPIVALAIDPDRGTIWVDTGSP